ncbi:MAG: hypothetical protein GXY60_01015 [Spirochaetales bacterium]|jgi:hypothetical protein|nr:hypothetical protein [Spirochaetales bacterium]
MTRDKMPLTCISELYDQLVSLFEEAPDHGKITLSVFIRDGYPYRYETTKETSILYRGGNE